MVPFDQSVYIQSLFNNKSNNKLSSKDHIPEIITVQVVKPMLREDRGGDVEASESLSSQDGLQKHCCP
jgi:hypothetical protein